MRKIIIVIICLTLFSVFSVNAFAQTLHVDVNMDKLTKSDCALAPTVKSETKENPIIARQIISFIFITSVVSQDSYLISHFLIFLLMR